MRRDTGAGTTGRRALSSNPSAVTKRLQRQRKREVCQGDEQESGDASSGDRPRKRTVKDDSDVNSKTFQNELVNTMNLHFLARYGSAEDKVRALNKLRQSTFDTEQNDNDDDDEEEEEY